MIFRLLLFVLLVNFSCEFAMRMKHTKTSPSLPRKALQNPKLFGGDMVGINASQSLKLSLIPAERYRWPGGEVPYEIDDSLQQISSLIMEAMGHFHQSTCIQFKEHTDEENYIKLVLDQGCYSSVGMQGGEQIVSLGEGCHYVGTVIHELNHAVGFYHEQNRSDRDGYIAVLWQNIQREMEPQFEKLYPHQNILLDGYDYESIMHYGSTAFSVDGYSNTMVRKRSRGQVLLEPYEKSGMTSSDISRINKAYKCQQK